MKVLKYAGIMLLGVLFMLFLIAVTGFTGSRAVKYTREGIVYECDDGMLTIKDTTGNLWVWECSEANEGLSVGTCVNLRMSDNGTEAVEDDVILSVTIRE